MGGGQKSARAGTDLTRFQKLLAAAQVPMFVLCIHKASGGRDYHYTHFTDETIEAQRHKDAQGPSAHRQKIWKPNSSLLNCTGHFTLLLLGTPSEWT